MAFPWHLYLMAFLYLLMGLNHFRVPRMYVKMIPPSLPMAKILNIISGLAEVVLAVLLCIPGTSLFAAWGIIILLIAIFPANIYMYTNDNVAMGLPKWIRLIRLPLQLALIYWSYLYT
jgi:uncharacterized membrane protein